MSKIKSVYGLEVVSNQPRRQQDWERNVFEKKEYAMRFLEILADRYASRGYDIDEVLGIGLPTINILYQDNGQRLMQIRIVSFVYEY